MERVKEEDKMYKILVGTLVVLVVGYYALGSVLGYSASWMLYVPRVLGYALWGVLGGSLYGLTQMGELEGRKRIEVLVTSVVLLVSLVVNTVYNESWARAISEDSGLLEVQDLEAKEKKEAVKRLRGYMSTWMHTPNYQRVMLSDNEYLGVVYNSKGESVSQYVVKRSHSLDDGHGHTVEELERLVGHSLDDGHGHTVEELERLVGHSLDDGHGHTVEELESLAGNSLDELEGYYLEADVDTLTVALADGTGVVITEDRIERRLGVPNLEYIAKALEWVEEGNADIGRVEVVEGDRYERGELDNDDVGMVYTVLLQGISNVKSFYTELLGPDTAGDILNPIISRGVGNIGVEYTILVDYDYIGVSAVLKTDDGEELLWYIDNYVPVEDWELGSEDWYDYNYRDAERNERMVLELQTNINEMLVGVDSTYSGE